MLVLLLAGACLPATGQTPVTKHYGVNEGLPSSECYWVIQDSRGYLWTATDAGVVKYDGYKFTTYNSSRGLPDNTVFKIHEDHRGRVWFASYSGRMSYYSYQTDSIYGIPVNPQLDEMVKDFPVDFAFDPGDTLYVCNYSRGYIRIYPPAYKQMDVFKPADTLYFVKSLGKNNVVYGTTVPDQLTRRKKFDDNDDSFGLSFSFKNLNTGYRAKAIFNGAAMRAPHKHCIRYNDTLLLYTFGLEMLGVTAYDQKILYNWADINTPVISIGTDSKKRIWVNLKGKGSLVLSGITQPQRLFHLLPSLSVTSMCEDTDGGIWLTTLEDGLYYIPLLDSKCMNERTGLSVNKVFSIALMNDKLHYLTADFTIGQYDISSNQVLKAEKLDYSAWFLVPADSSVLVCQTFSYILGPDNKKTFLVDKTASQHCAIKKAINYNSRYFTGFNGGYISMIDKRTGHVTTFINNLPMIFSICLQGDILWIGTKQGLYSYQDKKIRYHGNDHELLKTRVESMACSGDTLFLATRGYGLACLVKNKIVAHYTEADGLASNMTKYVTVTPTGHIWIATNRGISLLKRSGKNFMLHTINVSSGLVSNEVNHLVEYKDKLYMATNGGLEVLDAQNFYHDNASIPVYIEKIMINNSAAPLQPNYHFAYNQNFLSISYKGVSVRSQGDINYKYRLEGLDTSWIYTRNTYVQYTTLPAGNYRFVVYAINNNGKSSMQPAVVSFVIEKPFWKTVGFILLMVLVAVAAFYFLYRNRVRFIQKQEKEKAEISRKISESELKALRAQMNPHFMFNAINSIQNFVLKNDSASAQKYLTKFARLIRSVLENSKRETVLLSKEIEALQLYMELEALRASFSFDHELVLQDNIKADYTPIPPMIIQPYIENAILHGLLPLAGRKGKLSVIFSQKGDVLTCIIDDNGIGREKAWEIKQKKQLSHQSMGMAVTEDRMQILSKHRHSLSATVNVRDKFSNGQPAGTTVEINIHLNPSYD